MTTVTTYGTNGNDIIDTEAGRVWIPGFPNPFQNDLIYAYDGDDYVTCRGLNDTVYGGHGDDDIISLGATLNAYGEWGDDSIQGASGNDTIVGGIGADTLLGGSGNDNLYGDSGNDELHGENGNDFMKGFTGDDLLFGGYGIDTIEGGSGNDTLYGDHQRDYLTGGSGSDDFMTWGMANGDQDVIHDYEDNTDTIYTNVDPEILSWYYNSSLDQTVIHSHSHNVHYALIDGDVTADLTTDDFGTYG